MKLPANPNRRTLMQGIGALSSAAAIPSLAATDFNNEAAESEPELAKYGIRNYYAPEIELDYWIDANGKSTSFSVLDQKGKWVFLKFFQNWCPGCHKSGFPTLKKFADAFHEHPDVAIAAVQTVFEGFSSNTQSAVRELQLRYELPFTMGHDAGTDETQNHPLTMINYRTGGTPWLVLIDPDGTVVFNDFHVNPEGLIKYVQEQVA
ncbi:MAG: TlpA disulfide reductase family protein [Granulosicoccaceae bacterium]